VTIAREQITERLKVLRQEEERLLAQLNQVSGAIAECEWSLEWLSRPEPAPAAPAAPVIPASAE
jgi:hypothetical protein